jgi:oxygen-dependent protoporphyrinogen oxidase
MLAAHGQMRARARQNAREQKSSGAAPRPIFTALRGGMQQLVDAITAHLDPASVRLGTPVSALRKTAEGWTVEAEGKAELYDAVIMASPAWAAGALLEPVNRALAEDLRAIPYSSSITINLVYDESKIGRLPDGFGFLVPASEGRSMLAATFVHRKFLGRTPPGKAVIRTFLGGMKNEYLLNESDEALVAIVRRELSEILGERVIGLAVEPEHTQVSRWRRAMAQYAVGHQERAARIAEHAAALPGLRLAGNAYDGIGVPDCIRLGRLAARELVG